MKVEEYLSIPAIKENEEFLMGNYKREFNMTTKDILEGFVSVKDWVVDFIDSYDKKILDISGHSLFSPLLVFKGMYKSYSMFDPGNPYRKINWDALEYINNEKYSKYKIKYVNTIRKDYYDVILDWNGKINFGNNFNIDMFSILIDMMRCTKEWVIFQSKAHLKLKNLKFDFYSFFNSLKYEVTERALPLWAKHPDGYTFVIKEEK